MKKIFTLAVMGAFVLIGKKSKAQINENFENGLASLTANCWQFPSTLYATNPSFVINGNGSLYSSPPVNPDSLKTMRTPLLIVSSSINVSFNYMLSNNLSGQATRTITIDLTDNNGVVVQNLTSFNVASNATSSTAFNQTFSVTTPGLYRLSISFSGSNGGGNARISIDDLYESEAVYGCLLNAPLAVKLINFQGSKKDDKISLQWTIASNETVDRFEIERSLNGRDFMTAALVMTNDNAGDQSYAYHETVNSGAVYYRLKMIDKNQVAEYSKTLAFRAASNTSGGIRIINNPVNDKLTFSFSSSVSQAITIKVYDASGRMQMLEKQTVYEGSNVLSLSLDKDIKSGLYVMEVTDGATSQSAKFVKQ